MGFKVQHGDGAVIEYPGRPSGALLASSYPVRDALGRPYPGSVETRTGAQPVTNDLSRAADASAAIDRRCAGKKPARPLPIGEGKDKPAKDAKGEKDAKGGEGENGGAP